MFHLLAPRAVLRISEREQKRLDVHLDLMERISAVAAAVYVTETIDSVADVGTGHCCRCRCHWCFPDVGRGDVGNGDRAMVKGQFRLAHYPPPCVR